MIECFGLALYSVVHGKMHFLWSFEYMHLFYLLVNLFSLSLLTLTVLVFLSFLAFLYSLESAF